MAPSAAQSGAGAARIMIEGHIESLSPDGRVHGWVRDTGSLAPCHVQVLHCGEVVAEAMAAHFRPDLLRAGHGHGHHGFAARLRRPLPPGPCGVALHLPRYGRTAPMGLHVPTLDSPAAATVESLLAVQPSWTVADLLAFPACLDAAGNLSRMGTPRFVDAMYRFVLGRWPSRAEARLHTDNLDRVRLTPQDFLIDLLRSGERADIGPDLLSPFDPIFPFTFA
jgi:hypothetical protein